MLKIRNQVLALTSGAVLLGESSLFSRRLLRFMDDLIYGNCLRGADDGVTSPMKVLRFGFICNGINWARENSKLMVRLHNRRF